MKKYVAYILILVIVAGSFFVYKKINPKKGSLVSNVSSNVFKEEKIGGVGWEVKSGTLVNTLYGFSVAVPDGLKVNSFSQDDGDFYLMQGELDNIKDFSFQIFVREYGDNVNINIAMIKKDIPDLKMIEPIEIKTDGDDTVAFYSQDDGEKYREIWIIHNGYLYQIISKASNDNITGQIMETWKWSK